MLKKVFMSRKKRLTVTSLKNNPAIYTYHRDEHHDLDDEDGWFAMGILSTIIGVWWGIFHWIKNIHIYDALREKIDTLSDEIYTKAQPMCRTFELIPVREGEND